MMPNNGDSSTLVDSRDERQYTVAKINNQYWMTQNLDLAGGTTITNGDSNITATSYTLPASSTNGFSDSSVAYVYNSGYGKCEYSSSKCFGYYSFAAATAGTNPSSGDATSDICPKGWRLPTRTELTSIAGLYPTGNDITAAPFLGVYAGYFFMDNTFTGGASEGQLSSSTAYNNNSAYYLDIDKNSNNSVGNNWKYRGRSIRCVKK